MVVVKDVSRQFEGRSVLRNLSFHIHEGENVGLIGRNGAGKTTLLKILTGQIKESSGFVRVKDCRSLIEDNEKLKETGFMSGERSQLWYDMKLSYSYDNCAKMYCIKSDYKARLMKLADVCGINHCMNKPVNNLSLGQRIRAELVYVLLPQPKLLIMDEALVGLDVAVKEDIINLLTEIKSTTDTTIIYTTHNLSEIERLCDRVILLDNGEIIFDGSTKKIMKEYSTGYSLSLKICGKLPDMEDLPVDKIMIDNDKLTIIYDRNKIPTAVILEHIIKRNNCDIAEIHLEAPNLEDTVKMIYADM